MKALSLSKSTPSRGKGKNERACLIVSVTSPPILPEGYTLARFAA